jgi:glc operon protein GlcG
MRVLLPLALYVVAATAAGPRPSSQPGVVYLPAAQVADAFAQGRPLVETGAYKVHASRRDKAGLAEIHVDDTDIIYVLDGTATIVTGGTVEDGKTSAPGEIRGSAIQGGETRRLAKGDVAIVPNGVPHWFQHVDGTFLYYVVKVSAASGGAK